MFIIWCADGNHRFAPLTVCVLFVCFVLVSYTLVEAVSSTAPAVASTVAGTTGSAAPTTTDMSLTYSSGSSQASVKLPSDILPITGLSQATPPTQTTQTAVPSSAASTGTGTGSGSGNGSASFMSDADAFAALRQPPQLAFGWFVPKPPVSGPYFWCALPPGYALLPTRLIAAIPRQFLPTYQPAPTPINFKSTASAALTGAASVGSAAAAASGTPLTAPMHGGLHRPFSMGVVGPTNITV